MKALAPLDRPAGGVDDPARHRQALLRTNTLSRSAIRLLTGTLPISRDVSRAPRRRRGPSATTSSCHRPWASVLGSPSEKLVFDAFVLGRRPMDVDRGPFDGMAGLVLDDAADRRARLEPQLLLDR